jgi:hypothetical protein
LCIRASVCYAINTTSRNAKRRREMRKESSWRRVIQNEKNLREAARLRLALKKSERRLDRTTAGLKPVSGPSDALVAMALSGISGAIVASIIWLIVLLSFFRLG